MSDSGKTGTAAQPDASRQRRDRADIRELLLQAAIGEFAVKGYDGASTLAIARRAEAHQPQINYHFGGKEQLWRAAVDQLFGGAAAALVPASDIADPGRRVAEVLRELIRYFAAHPQLCQIMANEAAADSDRLAFIVERFVRPFYDMVRDQWVELQAAGIAAPIDARLAHYVIVGAASMPFVQAAEARLLGVDPFEPATLERYVEGVVATLLPGLPTTD